MINILVPLNVRVRRKEGACFLRGRGSEKSQSGEGMCSSGYVTSSVPENSRFANAEIPPFIIGEMLLEYVLIAHSLPHLLHHGEKYAVNAAVSTACEIVSRSRASPKSQNESPELPTIMLWTLAVKYVAAV